MDSSVKIIHPILYGGLGRLVLDEDVVLGSWMSGASSMPIVLQPASQHPKFGLAAEV